MNIKYQIEKVKAYITKDIWRLNSELKPKKQFFLIRIVRMFILAVRRFYNDDCMVRASALTYYSLLSVVPLVALAFAIAKGFGFRENLELELQRRLSGHEEVFLWVKNFALDYLENTKGGAIAGVGVAVLLWSIMKILGNIEKALNDIWKVKNSRSFFRKFTNYISFMVVSTILLVASSSFLVFITSKIQVFDIGYLASQFINWAAPHLMVWFLFVIMFLVLPNTKVKIGPAVFGGIFTGTLFILLQFIYIKFQVGVSRYNAIYGSFAAIPLFLIWMRSSWLIILFGAELAYAAQYERNYEFESETKNMSLYYRRIVSLMLVKMSAEHFKASLYAPSASDFAVSLKLPSRLVNELLGRLVASEVLTQVVSPGYLDEVRYAPAFDINNMTIAMVISRLEKYGVSDIHFAETEDYKKLKNIFENYNDIIEHSDLNQLIIDI